VRLLPRLLAEEDEELGTLDEAQWDVYVVNAPGCPGTA